MSDILPRSCIPVPKIEDDCYDWWERHEQKLAEAKSGSHKVVFIGDSITHFWTKESSPRYGGDTWAELFGGFPVMNLGYGFDRTQNVLWRLDHGEVVGQDPALFVINIGINQRSITPNYDGDTPEIAVAGIVKVWETVHALFPKAKIMAMMLFPCGGRFEWVSETNHLLKIAAAAHPYVIPMDLTYMLGDADGKPVPSNYQQDLCHLNENGYRIWGAVILPFVRHFAG